MKIKIQLTQSEEPDDIPKAEESIQVKSVDPNVALGKMNTSLPAKTSSHSEEQQSKKSDDQNVDSVVEVKDIAPPSCQVKICEMPKDEKKVVESSVTPATVGQEKANETKKQATEDAPRKNHVLSLIVILLALLCIIITILALDKYSQYENFSSYCEKANIALSQKEYEKAIVFYNEALKVPAYQDDSTAKYSLQKAKSALEQKTQFDKFMTSGKQYLEKKKWTSAENAFKNAVKVAGYENDSEAQGDLKKCEDYRNANATAFTNAVSKGVNALSNNDFDKALKSFDEALKIPGCENDETAIKQRDQARLNLDYKIQFESAMHEGRQCLNRKEWINAETAFNRALSVPGYSNNKSAKDSFKTAQEGLATQRVPVPGNDWKIPDIGMEFVWIKALDCWVGKYEVTNWEYRNFETEHDSKDYNGNTLNGNRQPVILNYYNTAKYVYWLTERERKDGRVPSGYSYRLPSEKEWTTFCQCGDGREYPWGNTMPPKYGNYCGEEVTFKGWTKINGYNDVYPVTCPVENSGKNDWGLYGVGGNVWECTVKSSSDLSFDAWRGGSWGSFDSDYLHSSFRYGIGASDRFNFYGFRLVL